MRETIKEYFTFSKKERTGILVLSTIVIATAVAPAFYSPDSIQEGDSAMIQRFNDQIKVLDAGDDHRNRTDSAYRERRGEYRNRQSSTYDPGINRGYSDYRKYAEQRENGDNSYSDYNYGDNSYLDNNYSANNYADNSAADNTKKRNDHRPEKQNYGSEKQNYGSKKQNVVMFDFDPNTITTAGWIQLGVSERTATTIEKYRSKGGRFRNPDDILRIYGLSAQDKERLLPYVKIPIMEAQSGRIRQLTEERESQHAEAKHPYSSGKPANDYNPYPRKISSIIDINTADSTAWGSLPGIGPVLSQRIIKYRDRLGGFYSIEQVGEVYGLKDSVYQKILPFLSLVGEVRKINVNEATPQLLGQHPYFRPPVARAIVDYRSQHGSFKEIDDLKQVVSITADLFNRISHYLTL